MARYKNSYLSYFLMYLFWYLSWALSAQFISVYLLGKGFSAAQVALVVSCPQHLPIPDLLVQVAQEFDSE
jgi:hypothetical protein